VTTIAAKIVEGGRVLLAGDTLVSGNGISHESTPKVWGIGSMCWGWAGRTLLARWVAQNPPPATPNDLDEWADRLRARAKEIDAWDDGSTGSEGLVCYAAPVARIYYIGCDCAVVPIVGSFFAIGSGAHYAIGAMAAGAAGPVLAVEIAQRYDLGTGGQIVGVESQ
jgi:ATP-dependent protease HslVU (ClpYQ) peptidase subunit